MANLSLAVGAVLTVYFWPQPERYLLAPVVPCVLGLLLGRGVAVLAAVALTFLPGLPRGGLLALWLGAAGFWVASDWLHAALRQAAERQMSALRLEHELLSRRGELRRLNDSLRNSYTLLERTNHELAEARDEAEEARRLKAQFAAMISHELRTPLNLILGFAEVMHKMPELYRGAKLTSDLRGDIREIYRSTTHLLELVDDVLDLSRVEQVRLALVPEDADIAALIQEAVATVAGLFRGKPVALRVDLPASLPYCIVDRTRIRQVLINLLTNAARFTERGEVSVSAHLDEAHQEIVASVADTGPGIPDEERARIFDAFYQVSGPLRREGGSGLGLAICKTFVEMNGGRIWLESRPGRGSCFRFTLPLHLRLRPPPGEWKLSAAPDPFGDSIVTLDAGGRFSARLSRALPGLKVHSTTRPDELPELVTAWHPKAVVAFVPEGDGAEALNEAVACPGLPLVSCYLSSGRPLSAYSNVRAVLSKPITGKALLDALDKLGEVNTLLLADDDEGMTRLAQRTLAHGRPGMRLLTAHDGKQALEILRQARPDALILDLAMPEMDGLAVLEAMAREGLDCVRVLVLTAMDLHSGDGVAARRLVVSSPPGLGEADVARYIEALAGAARPRYGVKT